ncbi:hypothetical protein [Phaeobacter inhibens]|uniref:hypothetical protein n=1 Tax=Phaeobacter inhibens TaxID=221822 RepID=UPI0021A6051B|nr:hypothetical protein [Phaeobacter inhibens]UWR57094.1 hypothetical protein K4F89_01145 [Phaeobacter inhibens]
MTCPPNKTDASASTRPSLSIDWEVYAAMLEDSDMPLEQQKELIETLWSIVVAFVDLGFDLNPVQQICGEAGDLGQEDPLDVVSLINQQTLREEE